MPSVPLQRLSLLLLAGLMLCALPIQAQTRAEVEFRRVEMQQNEAVVSWQMRAEPGVTAYRIERKAAISGSDQFMPVKDMTPHGTGRLYTWRDTNLHKDAASDLVEYRVSAVFSDGSTQTLFTQQLNYTATAIRRTWGSLKALFQ